MTRLVLAIVAAVTLATIAYYWHAWNRPSVPERWDEPEDGVQPWDPLLRHLVDPKQRPR